MKRHIFEVTLVSGDDHFDLSATAVILIEAESETEARTYALERLAKGPEDLAWDGYPGSCADIVSIVKEDWGF